MENVSPSARLCCHYEKAGENDRFLLQLTPWDEDTHPQLILLLAWTGKRTEALQQFVTCCQQLAEHLVIEPEATTQARYQTILESNHLTLAACRKSGCSRGIPTAFPEARKGFRGYEMGFSDKLLAS